MLTTASAWAAGNFSIKTTSIAESSGEWHIKVRNDLPRAPGMMHIPMRFTFSKEAVDERAIMSKGADPVHHRMVLDTPPKQIQSLDVDFADGSGKVFKSTYYEFDLQRANGYFEAGEYLVSLSGPDGDVGTAQKLTLTGDNPPVYRGSMDFGGSDTGKKKSSIQSVSSGLDAGTTAPGGGSGDDDSSSASSASSDVAPRGQRRQHGSDGRLQQDRRGRSREGPPEGVRLRRGRGRRRASPRRRVLCGKPAGAARAPSHPPHPPAELWASKSARV